MAARYPDTGADGQLSFSVLYKSGETPVFSVQSSPSDPKTAVVYTKRRFNRLSTDINSLWFNDTVKLKLTLKVSDNGLPSLSTNCFVLVTINDVNDNAPVFDYSNTSYSTYFLQSSPRNTKILRVFATDDDVGVNAEITYSLVSTNPSCNLCFSINSSSGWILSGNIPPITGSIVRNYNCHIFA